MEKRIQMTISSNFLFITCGKGGILSLKVDGNWIEFIETLPQQYASILRGAPFLLFIQII